MQKPELLILRESNGIPFVSKCSMCSNGKLEPTLAECEYCGLHPYYSRNLAQRTDRHTHCC
jgi:hypothetical protein